MSIHSIELVLAYFPDPLENNEYIEGILDEHLSKQTIKEIQYYSGKNKDRILYIFDDMYNGKLTSETYSKGIVINYISINNK